jgi:phosphoglycerate dehydrogenase-like enzyme
VLNTPGASTASVVELTLAHMLAAARGLQAADEGLKSGRWLKGQLTLGGKGAPRPGHELAGKRLGLLGFGRIAQSLAGAASALGMRVSAYSRQADAASAAALGVELVGSDVELFSSCSHVVVLCALNEETRGLVDRNRVDLMPTTGADGTLCGSHLFNMARGGIVVEEAVAAALQDGTLSTYAADVFEREPPAPTSPLLRCEGFHGTPHVGAATLEAQARVGMLIAEKVLAVLEGTPPGEGVVTRPLSDQ